jgi:alpha/beta superfamily hydrolase
MKRKVELLTLAGPAGELEALWEEPRAARSDLAGLVCHPHPVYGGTLHNKVVHHTALALQERRLPVLRFNFRRAGRSQGQHDNGRGEADDVRAALSYLEEKRPQAGLVLAGFSFGAWVGLRVGCQDKRVQALIGVGLPADDSDLSYLASCRKPKLFVQGTRDQFGSRAAMEALLRAVHAPNELIWIEGADHFFTGRLKELRAAIRDHFPGESAVTAAREWRQS